MPDVQRVFKSMANMVALLHAHDYVHLDIKPENIMRTANGDWKLIDVDGAVKTNSKISVEENTISFTPLYCAPEFARVLVEDCDYVHISRLMDVWSIGLTSLDLLLSQPALEHKYTEIVEATGDCMGYFEWLADRSIELGLPAQLERVDKDYYNMLQEHILVKDEKQRASIPEVMNHPFYLKDYTKRTQKSPREPLPQKPASMDQKVEKDEYGVHANQSRRWDKIKATENPADAPGDEGAGGGAAPAQRRQSTVIEAGVAAKKDVAPPYGRAGMSQNIKDTGFKNTNVLKGVGVKHLDDVG
jgi:serine/threonine protein kinase